MREVKCKWCKEKGVQKEMIKEVKQTEKTKTNSYYHDECHKRYLEDKEFKQIELNELDELYKFILSLHDLKSLDGRMMEKVQDLRNGTIKLKGKKIKKYKEGIPYSVMLTSYKKQVNQIKWSMRNVRLETKWNEFSYCFGIMSGKVNDIIQEEKMLKQKRKETSKSMKEEVEDVSEFKFENMKKKNDELDLSDFL